MNNWRVVQQRDGFYMYNATDLEVCKFLTEQLQSIIDHKYGLGEVWSKHYAQTIVDEASHVLLDMSQEIAEQIEKDEKDDYSY